ncbi:MAG: hypothetical protein LUC32_01890 [Clostridiales bacterium]|nr:hypothetical protein [Clostridiales bacterium]
MNLSRRRENIKVTCRLNKAEWKRSWRAKVVEDTKENKNAYRGENCFWGNFEDDATFVMYYHKEYEAVRLSLKMYFKGHIVEDGDGCRIEGSAARLRSTNGFLMIGCLLCLVAFLGSLFYAGDIGTTATTAVLMLILLFVYFAKPKKEIQQIVDGLKDISFDEKFYKRGEKAGEETVEKKVDEKVD